MLKYSVCPRSKAIRNILITGGAGFIGSHLADRLLADGCRVTVIDNFDPFYDPAVKRRNVAPHLANPAYRLVEADIRDLETMQHALPGGYDVIAHLAAKAGVRPSLRDPLLYQQVNVGGTQNLLELARQWGTPQFVFASSSSVYGKNPDLPWRESSNVLLPISPYAATKVSGELLGHVYSHLYGIRFVALRFFTVYGPRQRPDLAIHKFAQAMLGSRSFPLYGDGNSSRDYTFVADIVRGIRAAMGLQNGDYHVINLGNNRTVSLAEMVSTLERLTGKQAKIDRQPDQPGDLPHTRADISRAAELLGYSPETTFEDGVKSFLDWLTKGPA
jgi:UDP-glucuronate 4-epimerase